MVLRRMTATKILRATMPTNPAAIHSIVSMNRSIDARFMSAPNGCHGGEIATAENPAAAPMAVTCLLRERVVFGERGAQFGHRRVRIGAVLLDALAPGL